MSNCRSAYLQPGEPVKTLSRPTAGIIIVDDPVGPDEQLMSSPEAKDFWNRIRQKYLRTPRTLFNEQQDPSAADETLQGRGNLSDGQQVAGNSV